MKTNNDYKIILSFRKKMHNIPETAGLEKKTSLKILEFIKQFNPDKIIENIGGYGIAAIYNGKKQGKTIVFRADMDALPVNETNANTKKNAHLCGHDGHMAILAGLAQKLHFNKPLKGKIVLLYQPAEETGEGAKRILSDKKFMQNIHPNFVFALHNLPGFPINSIVLKSDTITSASVGLKVKLFGQTSHAAEPEKGISPVSAIASIIKMIVQKKEKTNIYSNFTLVTIINVKMGNKNFGISPGEGEISLTLRAFENKDFHKLKQDMISEIEKICKNEHLRFNIEWYQEFIATENNKTCVEKIEEAAKTLELNTIKIANPFRWSEDFSWFMKDFKGAFIGLGAGKDQPPLHSANYSFPDEIIKTGIEILYKMSEKFQ